jgi:hypothetical protein
MLVYLYVFNYSLGSLNLRQSVSAKEIVDGMVSRNEQLFKGQISFKKPVLSECADVFKVFFADSFWTKLMQTVDSLAGKL